ncbi:hypothetical protein GC173_16970 [bacterium]|nr:hypothetical protein [bacterium]
MPEPRESRYLAGRIRTLLTLAVRGAQRRRLEDHLAGVLPRGLAPQEIRRLATAASLYRTASIIDSEFRRQLVLSGDPLPSESCLILTLLTPFHARLGWHAELTDQRMIPLPVPRDKTASPGEAFAGALAAVTPGSKLFFARYSRPSNREEALHLTRLASIPSAAELGQRLSDALNLNPAYYDWYWSLEQRDEQSS